MPVECYENFDVSEIADENQTVVEHGDSFAVGDLTIHVRGGYDPDANGTVSYVLEHETGTIFHGGDNCSCEAFEVIGEEFDIDLGMLSYGTNARKLNDDGKVVTRKLYNDPDEIVEATNALGINRLVPQHWRRWRSIHADPSALEKAATTFEYPYVIEGIEVGDRLRLDRPGVVPPTHLDE